MNTQHNTTTQTHSTPLIPLQELFGYAQFNIPRYSPCKTYYTYLAPTPQGAPTLWITRTDGSNAARPLIPSQDRPLTNYQWLYTNAHIVYLQDTNGNEKWHLYLCDINTGVVTNLTPYPNKRVLPTLSLSKKHHTKIVFQCNARDETVYDVYEYSLTTNTLTCLETNPGNILNWYIDRELQVRAHTTFTTDNIVSIYTRDTIASPWHNCITWYPDNNWNSRVLYFSPCNSYLFFVDNRTSNTNLLQRLDIKTGEITPLFKDDAYDVYHESSVTDMLEKTYPQHTTLWSRSGTLLGFSYYRKRLTWQFFVDTNSLEERELILFLINPAFESWVDHHDSQVLILGRCSDTTPLEFWSYTYATQKIAFLGHTRPALQQYVFAHTTPIQTHTPDGLLIQGYLTLPTEATYTKVPLVLKIHGGPWSRDTFGFSPEIQMLANHGYACMQVDYRGSTGYGQAFSLISKKQLGLKMIDDVICMLEHVLQTYPIDSQRMVYMGRSYGGFSALSAGWRYQHLFKAIIAQVPCTSVKLFLDLYSTHWTIVQYHFRERVGHPEHDAELLDAQSPLRHAFSAKKPTLISYGMNDGRVPPEHIHRYLEAMDTTIPYQVIRFDDEGHFNQKEANLLTHWNAALEFIKRYI